MPIGSPDPSDSGPSTQTTSTCDHCRSLKVRCVPVTGEDREIADSRGWGLSCRRCFKRGVRCEWQYVFKKPGRPKGSSARARGSPSSSHTSASPRQHRRHSSLHQQSSAPERGRAAEEATRRHDASGPAFGSIFGSARSTFGTPTSSPWTTSDPASALPSYLSAPPVDPIHLAPTPSYPPIPSSTGSAPVSLLLNAPEPNPFSRPRSSLNHSTGGSSSSSPGWDIPKQIDDIAPWSDICFFLSLHISHQHALVPLLHKPTFAQDVLHRRDRTDEAFRGLLCSIVAYTICQCPVSTMIPTYSIDFLQSLLYRCQMASRAIQTHQQMLPTLVQASSVILDAKTSLATEDSMLTSVLFAEARRLVYLLGLHLDSPPADPATHEGGRDPPRKSVVDIEVGRRLFWELYANDKTVALNGFPLQLPDFEGLPPFPLEVDDEYLTPHAHLPQPYHQTSSMTGFLAITRIWQIVGQCQLRQKLHTLRTSGSDMSLGASLDDEVGRLVGWLDTGLERIREIMEGLPKELKRDFRELSFEEEGAEAVSFGIQQANIYITALVAEFVLMDFRSTLRPSEHQGDKEVVAKRAYETLSSIPIEYLASNGESMRGKVLRIILALLALTNQPETLGDTVWDWWNMYSRVQFVQLIPDRTRNARPDGTR